jgi:glucan phosphoethanolaminetransferase (alkaline phosphatase superfamily)
MGVYKMEKFLNIIKKLKFYSVLPIKQLILLSFLLGLLSAFLHYNALFVFSISTFFLSILLITINIFSKTGTNLSLICFVFVAFIRSGAIIILSSLIAGIYSVITNYNLTVFEIIAISVFIVFGLFLILVSLIIVNIPDEAYNEAIESAINETKSEFNVDEKCVDILRKNLTKEPCRNAGFLKLLFGKYFYPYESARNEFKSYCGNLMNKGSTIKC